MFWVISVYFNIRNTLPKSCTFLLGHPVYIHIHTYTHTHACIYIYIYICMCVCVCVHASVCSYICIYESMHYQECVRDTQLNRDTSKSHITTINFWKNGGHYVKRKHSSKTTVGLWQNKQFCLARK